MTEDAHLKGAQISDETPCERFRFVGVHPDGSSRLCECGLKYDEHRPSAKESSGARVRDLAERVRGIAESIVDTSTQEGKLLVRAADELERLQAELVDALHGRDLARLDAENERRLGTGARV